MRRRHVGRWNHLYPAIVRDVHDPMRSGRIKVECPPVYGVGPAHWSPWCLPAMASRLWSVPLEGDTVWIAFRKGDARFPVWLGRYNTYAADGSPEEFRALSEGPYKDDLRDAVDHQNVRDNNDHAKGHDHGAGEFWNPYVHTLLFPSGAGLLVDEEPGEQRTTLLDRIGQSLSFEGDPSAPLDPHDESRVGGEYDAPDLDDQNTLFQEEGLKARTRLQGRHSQFLEMRVEANDKEEELELHGGDIAGSHGSKLLFSNSELGKRFTLERFIPGYNQSHEGVIDPDALTTNYQRLYDSQGQEIKINSDDESPDRFVEIKNASGEKFEIAQDRQVMSWEDRTGTKIEYDIEAEVFTITHGTGLHTIKIDVNEIVATRDGGGVITLKENEASISNGATESITLSPSGIAMLSAGGVTINGIDVAVTDDVVNTTVDTDVTVDPNSGIGTGSGTGTGTVTGSGGV